MIYLLFCLKIFSFVKSNIFLNVSQQTGYVKINQNDSVFYWYFPCTNKSIDAPLVVWLTGGPGCSSELAVLFENGPYSLDGDQLKLNPYSWNQESNIVFIDFPGGTGFSIFNNEPDFQYTEKEVAIEFEQFLKGFLNLEFVQNISDFYIAGESYAGKYIPAISHFLLEMNYTNLKGIAIGNGYTDPKQDMISQRKYLYDNNVINKSIYKSSKQVLDQCIDESEQNYLGPTGYQNCNNYFDYIIEYADYNFNYYNINYLCEGNYCYHFEPIRSFLNQENVQQQLGVNQTWHLCNNTVYYQFTNDEYKAQKKHLAYVVNKGIKVLVYNGDKDFMCCWTQAHAWTKTLKWKKQKQFKKQKFVNWIKDQKRRGIYKKQDNLVFLRVLDAGHMVPHDQPISALYLLKEFLYTWFQ